MPEWSERWLSWPHCNGQNMCWAHYPRGERWCSCRCRWCRVARVRHVLLATTAVVIAVIHAPLVLLLPVVWLALNPLIALLVCVVLVSLIMMRGG